jgi:hypothetical protein
MSLKEWINAIRRKEMVKSLIVEGSGIEIVLASVEGRLPLKG